MKRSLLSLKVFFNLIIIICLSYSYSGFSQTVPPTSPTGLNLFPGDGEMYLHWNTVNDPNLAGYIIYREIGLWNNFNNGTYTIADTLGIEDSTYIDDSILNGNWYTYWVTAYTANGQSEPSPDYDGITGRPRFRKDTFGYTFSSNRDLGDESVPSYQWKDISDAGVKIPLSGFENNTGNYPIGFNFPFYYFAFDSFRISTSGFISFTSEQGTSNSIPEFPTGLGDDRIRAKNNPAEFNNIIAPFWTELYFESEQAYYQNFGDYTIIQFDSVSLAEYKTSKEFGPSNTFQIILYADGSFEFVYKKMQELYWQALGVGWQDHSTMVGVTVTHSFSGDGTFYDDIEWENLVISVESPFATARTGVPFIYFNEYSARGDRTGNIFNVEASGLYANTILTYMDQPYGIQFDQKNDKLYWIEAFGGGDLVDFYRSNSDGSGRSIFKNCKGTIFFPSNSTGSIRVIPIFCKTRREVRYSLENVIKNRIRFNPLICLMSDSSSS